MKNRNYKICRDNVFIGEVVKTDGVYRINDDWPSLRTKNGTLTTSSWFSLRSMLFVPDEKKLANDLLYQSPHYKALNVTDDDECLSIGKDTILLKDSFSMAPLLEHFGYAEELTYEDILEIRKRFFTGHFAMDNCQLFGWRETMAEDVTFYRNGIEVTDPVELEKERDRFRASQAAGHRSFSGINGAVLPKEYFHILDDRGDATSLIDVIEWGEKINAFKPHSKEGKIKRLSRF